MAAAAMLKRKDGNIGTVFRTQATTNVFLGFAQRASNAHAINTAQSVHDVIRIGFRCAHAGEIIKRDIRHSKRTTQKKPVILIKANRGKAGAKASASHSASLSANDSVCDQLLKSVGARAVREA